jgi:hypothetical protein
MRPEISDEPEDLLLHRVVAELHRPVPLDPGIDARVLDAIRATAQRRAAPWRPLAGAALAAGVMLALLIGRPGGAATREVRLRLSAPSSSHVTVVGDFNDWNPAGTPLRPTSDPGVWTIELRLKPGRYHYAFLLDGRRWVRDPAEPPNPDSDFGAPTSVITVS